MAKGDTHPNPFRLALDTQRKLLDAATEGVEKARIAGDRMETIENVDVGQTPSEVVYTENKLELLHYEPQTDEQHDVPIIITYALINRPYILDLQPDRSVVRRLLEAGHDVYLIDWNEPSRLDQHLTLADYVNRYMDNCVDVVRERSGQDSINLLGYCMGGTMSVMYTALHQEKVRTLGLMAAGLCFDDTGGVLELWGDEDYYDPEDVTEAFGNMPAEILDVGFALMDPVANYVSKYARLYDNLENEDFVENFARMETWLSEGIDVAGDAYVEFLRDIYQGNKLYNNEYYLDGEHVDVSSIEVPMLQIMGKYDHLIPAEASKPFNEVVGSDDVETIEYPTGHIGLAVSGSSHREVWPRVAQWYLEQSADRGDLREVAAAVADETGATVDVDVTEGDYGEAEVAVEAEGDRTTRVVDAEAEDVREVVSEAADVDLETEPEIVEPAATEASELEELEGISTADAADLTAAGIRTARELAEADPEAIADATDRDIDRARDWVGAARAEFDDLDVAVDDAGASKDEASGDPAADAAEAPADEGAAEPTAKPETESEEGGDADAEAESTGLESIDGIGPTYAERLRDAGVTDIEALAAADADEIAAAAEVGEQRAQDWIDAAGDR